MKNIPTLQSAKSAWVNMVVEVGEDMGTLQKTKNVPWKCFGIQEV